MKSFRSFITEQNLDETVDTKETLGVNYNGKKLNHTDSENVEEDKHWIAGAIKHPGALHKELGVPEGEKIPQSKLNAAAKKGGKEGERARLAKTLEKMHESEVDEDIKGWKHAGKDITKSRLQASNQAKSVRLHRVNSNGEESKMHDASSYFNDETEAREHHNRMVKLNPNKKIKHNLYVDGKPMEKLHEESLDEKKKEWGSTTSFQSRMAQIDKALSSKKKKLKDLRHHSNKAVNELWTTSDSPYDADGTIVEKKKKKLDEAGKVYHVHYAASKYHKQNVARYDDEEDAKKFLERVKKQGYNGMVVAKERNVQESYALDEEEKLDPTMHHVIHAHSKHTNKLSVASYKNKEDAEKFLAAIKKRGSNGIIRLPKKVNEGSNYFGVDPSYMNAADVYAKNKSFSPAAMARDPIEIVPSSSVVYDDNVEAMGEELESRLNASKQYEETVNELSKSTLASYVKKGDRSYDNLNAQAVQSWRSHERDGQQSAANRAMAQGKKANLRAKYLNKAENKLKEETVNELSKKTLSSYIGKAATKAVQKAYSAGEANILKSVSTDKTAKKLNADHQEREENKSLKRLRGVNLAAHKLKESKKLLNDKTIRLKDADCIDVDPKMNEKDK